jgi:hypothetical protein
MLVCPHWREIIRSWTKGKYIYRYLIYKLKIKTKKIILQKQINEKRKRGDNVDKGLWKAR